MALGILLITHGGRHDPEIQYISAPDIKEGFNRALASTRASWKGHAPGLTRLHYTMDNDNRDRREMECYQLSMLIILVS